MSDGVEFFHDMARTVPRATTGRISIAVQIENGKVVVLFSEKVDRLEMDPGGAVIVGDALIRFGTKPEGGQ